MEDQKLFLVENIIKSDLPEADKVKLIALVSGDDTNGHNTISRFLKCLLIGKWLFEGFDLDVGDAINEILKE